MKKVVNVCLLIIMCMCIFSKNVYAADSNLFSITSATGSKGEEVTVYISLDKEVEFASADLILEYDTSKLEFIKYDELDIFKKSAMNIVKNNADTGKIAIGYVSNPDDASLAKSPGKMLSITFKIKNVEFNTTKLNLQSKSLKKDSGEDIQVDDVQSEIKVVAKSNNADSNSTDTDNRTNEPNQNKQINVLPKTGDKISLITMFLILFTIISFYFYKKYIYLKNIK